MQYREEGERAKSYTKRHKKDVKKWNLTTEIENALDKNISTSLFFPSPNTLPELSNLWSFQHPSWFSLEI